MLGGTSKEWARPPQCRHLYTTEPSVREIYTRRRGGTDRCDGRRRVHGGGRLTARRLHARLLACGSSEDLLRSDPAGDSDRGIAAFYEAFSKRDCEPSCLRLFGTPERPVELLAAQDVIYVSGGNTANALALWRLHGVDEDAARRLAPRCCSRRSQRRRELLVRVQRDRLCSGGRSIRFTRVSGSVREASARTTTARSFAVRSSARSSTTDSRRATRPTTSPRSTSSAPSCARCVSSREGARALPRREPARRRRSPLAFCDDVFLRTL